MSGSERESADEPFVSPDPEARVSFRLGGGARGIFGLGKDLSCASRMWVSGEVGVGCDEDIVVLLVSLLGVGRAMGVLLVAPSDDARPKIDAKSLGSCGWVTSSKKLVSSPQCKDGSRKSKALSDLSDLSDVFRVIFSASDCSSCSSSSKLSACNSADWIGLGFGSDVDDTGI